jgi:long-chain acyl-CoA synthetase
MIAPKNPLYTDRELVEALGASRPSVAIVLSSFYERVKHLQSQTTVRRVISTNIKEYLPPLLRLLFTLFRERKEGYRVTLRDGDRQFAAMLREGKPATGRPAPEDPAILLMSGGTTGTPKAVVSAHRSLVMSGLQFDAWLREALDGPSPSLMLPLPLFHTYACAGAQSITITEGIPLILVPNPRDTADVVKTIHHEKPALFTAVPALFTALLQHPLVRSGQADFSSIRGCFSGAAALMAETKRRFEALTGGTIVEGYSLTEATMACTGNPLRGANKIGSVGMPMPDVFVKIVKADDATVELPPREVGEIVMQAPQLMLGYWNAPEETAEMLRDGLLYTGDLGYLDEDGYLFIVDRKKDLIKTSGFQVWPREIEQVLETHPAVAEAGVGGVKDERQSEIPVAWVVLREGATATPEELRSWCRQSLAGYKVPARVHIRKELPKTLIGKILRRELVAEENAR